MFCKIVLSNTLLPGMPRRGPVALRVKAGPPTGLAANTVKGLVIRTSSPVTRTRREWCRICMVEWAIGSGPGWRRKPPVRGIRVGTEGGGGISDWRGWWTSSKATGYSGLTSCACSNACFVFTQRGGRRYGRLAPVLTDACTSICSALPGLWRQCGPILKMQNGKPHSYTQPSS